VLNPVLLLCPRAAASAALRQHALEHVANVTGLYVQDLVWALTQIDGKLLIFVLFFTQIGSVPKLHGGGNKLVEVRLVRAL